VNMERERERESSLIGRILYLSICKIVIKFGALTLHIIEINIYIISDKSTFLPHASRVL